MPKADTLCLNVTGHGNIEWGDGNYETEQNMPPEESIPFHSRPTQAEFIGLIVRP